MFQLKQSAETSWTQLVDVSILWRTVSEAVPHIKPEALDTVHLQRLAFTFTDKHGLCCLFTGCSSWFILSVWRTRFRSVPALPHKLEHGRLCIKDVYTAAVCRLASVHSPGNSLRGLTLHFDPVHLGKQWKGFQMNQAFGWWVCALLGPSHRVCQECVCFLTTWRKFLFFPASEV